MQQKNEFKFEFSYPLVFKVLYKYGNFLVTPLLLLYLIFGIRADYSLFTKIYILVFLSFIIITFNYFFIKLYKTLPFKISCSETKILFTDFPFSSKQIEESYENITEISGGMLEKKLKKMIKLRFNQKKEPLAFFPTIKRYEVLLTLLLNKVNQEVYNHSVSKL